MAGFEELFTQPSRPNSQTDAALILGFLLSRLLGGADDEETVEEHRQREIPVRPRVEPLGG